MGGTGGAERRPWSLAGSAVALVTSFVSSAAEGMALPAALLFSSPALVVVVALWRGSPHSRALAVGSAVAAWLVCFGLMPFFFLGLYFAPAALLLTLVAVLVRRRISSA